jgi:hypothetical protein
MQYSEKPSYQFLAKIKSGEYIYNDVPVKVFLPRKMTGALSLLLCPTQEQASQLSNIFEFSLEAEQRGYAGRVEKRFRAERIYLEGDTIQPWDMGLYETQMMAVPYDFAKWDIWDLPSESRPGMEGRFWLSPCQLISPCRSVSRTYSGKEVTVKTLGRLRFALKSGLNLDFDFVYRHFDEQNGDCVYFSELVANFEDNGPLEGTQEIKEKHLDALDEFLLLTSFAARQRCVCVGWEARDSRGAVTFYRRDFTILSLKPNENSDDALIDKAYFEDFLNIAYASLVRIEPRDAIRHVLHAVTAEVSMVEMGFIRLFSALETLVLMHRRETNGELIFTHEHWNRVVDGELKKAIKSTLSFKDDKIKRRQVYKNLSALNRVSLQTAYDNFCAHYQIDLNDLWPVFGRQETTPLSDIRNWLVHGESLSRNQCNTLINAKQHLEWILERIILAIIGWSVEKSRVSPKELCCMTSYLNWRGSTLD